LFIGREIAALGRPTRISAFAPLRGAQARGHNHALSRT
jgi:hypothetical protein